MSTQALTLTVPVPAGGTITVPAALNDGDVLTVSVKVPSPWVFGAKEGGTFTLPAGNWTVRYGAGTTYTTKTFAGGTKVVCSNGTFGDPLVGTVKHCDYEPAAAPPPSGAFLSYPKVGNKTINGQAGVELDHLSFTGNATDALVLTSCKDIYLHDLDFDGNTGCIYLLGCSGTLRIEDIRARNTGDGTIGSGHSNVIQLNQSTFTNDATGGIRRIKSLGGNTEDMVSLYQSGGSDAAHRLVFELSAFESPLPPDPLAYQSGSGSGSMVESGHHIVIQHNTYLNVGQGGIGFNGGDDVHYLDNIVYLAQRVNSNVGIYALTAPDSTGGLEVSRNRSWAWHNSPSYANPAWKPDTVTGVVGWDGTNTNVWQDASIVPASLHVTL